MIIAKKKWQDLTSLFDWNIVFIQRAIQGIVGIISLIVVTRTLTSDYQGWYYSFSSIVAVYSVFDFGMSLVIIQLTAHIFSKTQWKKKGFVCGQTSQELKALLSESLKFYAVISAIFLLAVLPFGVCFFSLKTAISVMHLQTWLMPWVLLTIFTALNILTVPYLSVVEGSGSFRDVYFLRIAQNLFSSVGLWVALILGLKLWALSVWAMLNFATNLIWIIRVKPALLKISLRKPRQIINWREDIWPLQWRVGLSFFSGYLLTQIYTPVLFYFAGPVAAGQMGLSLTIANMLGLLAQSWIARGVPDLAKSVANKDWEKFERTFKNDFRTSILMYLLGGLLLSILVILIDHFSQYGERVLPILSFMTLLGIVLVNHINSALAVHLRSYKKEPLVFVFLISTIVTIPIALYGASEFSVNGVVAAIFFVQLLFTLPATVFYWFKFNREWRLN